MRDNVKKFNSSPADPDKAESGIRIFKSMPLPCLAGGIQMSHTGI